MKHTIAFLLSFLLTCLIASIALGQSDSTFSVMRNGAEAKFPFKKFTTAEQFKSVSNTALPMYSFNRAQYVRIKSLLSNFTQLESDYKVLLINRDKKDSIGLIKEKTLTEGFKLQEERAKNFESSYNSLLKVNAQLDEQLKKAEQLAIHEHRKKNLRSILVGVLAFSAGVVIGVTVR
jgi:hypothetical protein